VAAVASPPAASPPARLRARRPLRVCMVHYSDFSVDSRIQRQARALAERGDEVHLICLSPAQELRVGAGRIRIHPTSTEKAGGGASAYLRGYLSFFLRALWRVSALDARRPFDVVEAHNMPDFLVLAGLVPKLRGTPVILNVHDTFPELFATTFDSPHAHRVARALRVEESVSAAVADAVVTVTDEARDLLNERGVGAGRTVVVMNSPDERLFGPQRRPRPFPVGGPVRAIYHGGLAPRFGADLLIRTMGDVASSLPELSLRICGTGDAHARLAALAARVAPGRVDLAPEPVPLRLIASELERANLGVVPTRRDHFTELLLPVKLLEYVHMGLPVVAPRLPVIERHFGDEEVRFFAPGSQASLAEALEACVADPAAAQERARRAGERLKAFTWAHQREAYLGLVDGLCSERAAA
jgi:glycosyltransferase involved in cell wall biosynthesis